MPTSRMRNVCTRTKKWKRCVLYTIIVIYGVIPAFVLLFPGVVSFIVLSYSFPLYFGDLKDPTSAGLEAARCVFVKTPSEDTIGLWHILPESAIEEKAKSERVLSDAEFDSRLASGMPIFIYVHGSGNTRGQFTRVYTYTALRGQDWHVIAFDYRGFADSSGEASESNMAEDTVTVYRWVKKHSGSSPVFLWGHSLGSGVVTQAARLLSSKHEAPDGIVLEGAFNNLHDLLEVALIMTPYKPFPFLLRIFQDALKSGDTIFASDQHLQHVDCPILMLHAEDDRIVPVELAHKLFQSIMTKRTKDQGAMTMHVFPAEKRYGHNQVNQAPDLGNVVRQFVQNSVKARSKA